MALQQPRLETSNKRLLAEIQTKDAELVKLKSQLREAREEKKQKKS